jgi:urease accessory protein
MAGRQNRCSRCGRRHRFWRRGLSDRLGMTVPARLFALALLVLWPEVSEAHSPIPGIGAFYGGFLHPILVPSQLVLLLAVNLAVGGSSGSSARSGSVAIIVGLAVGLALGSLLPVAALSSTILLVAALVFVIPVIVAATLAPSVALLCSCAAGLLVGFDSAPESGTFVAMLLASVGTIVGGALLTLIVLALSLSVSRDWQRIGIRVLGSWIAAASILVASLSFRH